MSEVLEPADSSPPLDATGRIDADIACAGCRYNLRGLDLAANCPECGLAVAESMYGNLLRSADRRWLRRMVRGIRCVGVAAACVFGIAGLRVFMTAMDREFGTEPLDAALFIVPATVLIAGSHWFTAAEPSIAKHSRRERPVDWNRVVARGFCWLLFVDTLMLALSDFYRIPAGHWLAWMALASAALVSTGRHARSLARRIPDAQLAANAGFVAHSTGCAGAVACLLIVGDIAGLYDRVVFDGSPHTGVIAVIAVVIVFMLILLAICGLWIPVLLMQFNDVLMRIARGDVTRAAAPPQT